MIDNASFFDILLSFISKAFYLLKFLLLRRNFGRFILLTPSVLKRQLIFDRISKKLVSLFIRDGIDMQTLKMIWLWEDYDLNRLRRGEELFQYYESVVTANEVPLIIDLGGHSGFSASYFAYKFPKAKIVCLEPIYSNFKQALVNTNFFSNIDMLNLGIGNICGRGEGIDPGLGNDSFRIKFSEKLGSIEIVNVDYLLKNFPKPNYIPFIVKCDIEGSEMQLFQRNTEWVSEFPLLIFELHDWLFPMKGTSKNFLKTITNLNVDFVHSGENVFIIK